MATKKNIKIYIFAMAIFLLVTFALSACTISCDSFLLQQHRVAAIEQLQEYAEDYCETDFCEENWKRIQGHIESGINAINKANTQAEIDSILAEVKQKIRVVPRTGNESSSGETSDKESSLPKEERGYSECGRFSLQIIVAQTTLPHGEGFIVNIVFKNISDYDIEIQYFGLFAPYINGLFRSYLTGTGPWAPRVRLMEAGMVYPNCINPTGLCDGTQNCPFCSYFAMQQIISQNRGGGYTSATWWFVGTARHPNNHALDIGQHYLTFSVNFADGTRFFSNAVRITVT